MAFPRRLLADGERSELELHPHAKALVRPAAVLLLIVPLASYAAARLPEGGMQTAARVAVAAVAVGLVAALSGLPFLRWVTTHYVVTDQRLITRRGVMSRSGRDVPLARVNDISFSHNLFERILGCGTLVVESGGERGQLVLADVPRVEDVQRRIHDLAARASGEGRYAQSWEGDGGDDPRPDHVG